MILERRGKKAQENMHRRTYTGEPNFLNGGREPEGMEILKD
jgi:hypothetical protein